MADHETDFDWAALGPVLERGAEVQSPLYTDAVAWLASTARADREDIRLVVDVGAGPGVITALLAAAFPSARVIALDGSPELLALAAERARRSGLGERMETLVVDLPDGMRDLVELLGAADVVWSSHVLHHLGDQQDAIRLVGGLLRPGGLLGIAEGGLPMRTLPRDIGAGRPGLEARLDAGNEAWFAEMRAELPGATPAVEHWPALIAAAGLHPSGSRTFLLDLPAPLDRASVELVRRRFERSRETLSERIEADDLAVLDLLLDADQPDGLDQRDDVFVLTATTVHLARAAG